MAARRHCLLQLLYSATREKIGQGEDGWDRVTFEVTKVLARGRLGCAQCERAQTSFVLDFAIPRSEAIVASAVVPSC